MPAEEMLRSVKRTKKTKNRAAELQEKFEQQKKIEEAIVSYQNAIAANDKNAINMAYERVCRLYQPLAFVQKWFQYRYLYDSREDFVQDYLCMFCTSLISWKPRDSRPESKYGGSGEFKNYFWSTLSNTYSNMVKADAAGKRNHSSNCPICHAWCNPLSTHLLKNHEHLLWEQLDLFNCELDALDHCPFCVSYKPVKTVTCEHGSGCSDCLRTKNLEKMKDHLLSKHSTYLFERFQELYPQSVTVSSKPMSVYYDNDGEDETNIYDLTEKGSGIDKLLSHNLTDIQKKIIEQVCIKRTKFSYNASVYDCSAEEFEQELESLKETMSLCGLEG